MGRASYGGLHVRGMGDRLSHNLAHDALGQFVTPNGPLTMLDSNEIFNTGCAFPTSVCRAIKRTWEASDSASVCRAARRRGNRCTRS